MLQSELMSNFVASKTFYEQINSVNCKEFSRRPASEVRECTVGCYAALVIGAKCTLGCSGVLR